MARRPGDGAMRAATGGCVAYGAGDILESAARSREVPVVGRRVKWTACAGEMAGQLLRLPSASWGQPDAPIARPIRKTWPSGWRTCISRTPHGFVGRRIGDLELLSHAPLVHRVDVINPDRYPRALVRSLIDSRAAGLGVRAAAAAAVTVTAEEDLAAVAARRVRRRRGIIGIPLELLEPAEPAEPRKARLHVAYVEDGHDLLNCTAISWPRGASPACRTRSGRGVLS